MIREYIAPAPIPPPMCPACRTFAPECVVPGEMFGKSGEAVPMCWLCAHAVIEHGGTLEDAHERVAACKCSAHDIYPADVISRRAVNIYTSETGAEIQAHAVEALAPKPAHVARSSRMTARERSALNRKAAESRWDK